MLISLSIYKTTKYHNSVNTTKDNKYKMKINVIIEVVVFSPLKLPMKAMPTEYELCSFAWAPTIPHPRPSYTSPSPEIRKLEEHRVDD